MIEELMGGLALAGMVTGLLQIAKPYLTDPRLHPLAALVLGVGLTMAFVFGDVGDIGSFTYGEGLVFGIYNGLVAGGVYEAVKRAPGSSGGTG